MTPVQRLTREPALLIGAVTAAVGLVTLFGIDISQAQLGAIVAFLGAGMALVRYLTTPSAEVLAQLKPGAPAAIAGPASVLKTGVPVSNSLIPVDTDDAPTLEENA